MKLSEALSEIKRTEGELMRLWELRDGIINSDNENLKYNSALAPEQIESAQTKFLAQKVESVAELDAQIVALIDKLVGMKVKVNRMNVAIGLDEKLQRIKYSRIELSKLMNIIKRGKRRYLEEGLNANTRAALKLDERIKRLEKYKSALDAEIQGMNWSTKVE